MQKNIKTSGTSMVPNTVEKSTSSPAAHHASPTPLQENERELMMNATCGPQCIESFKKSSQLGLWAKTFADLLVGMPGWSSMRCKLTWKLRDMGYKRSSFLLQASALRTDESEYGLLPTPTANEPGWRHIQVVDKYGKTPTYPNQRFYDKRTGRLVQKGLASLLHMGLLPTPTATSDSKGGCTRKDVKRQKATLAHAMHGAFGKRGESSQLNPRFVEEMMGFPIGWTELKH